MLKFRRNIYTDAFHESLKWKMEVIYILSVQQYIFNVLILLEERLFQQYWHNRTLDSIMLKQVYFQEN